MLTWHEMDPSEIIMWLEKSLPRRTVTARGFERGEEIYFNRTDHSKPPQQIKCMSHMALSGLVVRYPPEFSDPCSTLSFTCSRIYVKGARSQKLCCEIVKYKSKLLSINSRNDICFLYSVCVCVCVCVCIWQNSFSKALVYVYFFCRNSLCDRKTQGNHWDHVSVCL